MSPSNVCDRQARQRGFDAIGLLEGDHNLGIFLNRLLVIQQAGLGWAAAPKQLDTNRASSSDVSVRWSGGTGSSVLSPTAKQTKVTFARSNRAEGSQFSLSVRVLVKDQDGFSKTVSRSVQIVVVDPDDLRPVCRVKPWLPQCQQF